MNLEYLCGTLLSRIAKESFLSAISLISLKTSAFSPDDAIPLDRYESHTYDLKNLAIAKKDRFFLVTPNDKSIVLSCFTNTNAVRSIKKYFKQFLNQIIKTDVSSIWYSQEIEIPTNQGMLLGLFMTNNEQPQLVRLGHGLALVVDSYQTFDVSFSYPPVDNTFELSNESLKSELDKPALLWKTDHPSKIYQKDLVNLNTGKNADEVWEKLDEIVSSMIKHDLLALEAHSKDSYADESIYHRDELTNIRTISPVVLYYDLQRILAATQNFSSTKFLQSDDQLKQVKECLKEKHIQLVLQHLAQNYQ